MHEHNNTPNKLSIKDGGKDRAKVLQMIRTHVENVAQKNSDQIFEYAEIQRYNLALQFVSTSNKAVCESMQIPVEAGTRYKATLEKSGLLVSSTDKFQCPYTGEWVHFLSTNPAEFENLRKLKNDTQLSLF